MNNVIDVIMNRRSIRVFSREQIKKEELDTILQAGLYAPSAHNQQSWHFTVITNQKLLDDMSNTAKEIQKEADDSWIRKQANNQSFQTFYHAPTVVYISGEEGAMMPWFDCAVAAENILLAAKSIDIGACCIGFANVVFASSRSDMYKKRLQIPSGYTPYIAVSLGYRRVPNGKPRARREGTINYV